MTAERNIIDAWCAWLCSQMDPEALTCVEGVQREPGESDAEYRDRLTGERRG